MLDDFFNSVIGIQLKKHHEIYVVPSSTIQNRNILDADDGRHTFVSADTEHTENFFTELDTCDYIIQYGKEVVFVGSMFVDVFHVFENFREIFA